MGKVKFVFKLSGDEKKNEEAKALDDEIAEIDANIERLKQGRPPVKPPRKKPDRRIVVGNAVPFDRWASVVKSLYKEKYNIVLEGGSNRVDILPKDKSDWRISILGMLGSEFSITMFFGWKNEEMLNIKKHSIEFIKMNLLDMAINILLENLHKLQEE